MKIGIIGDIHGNHIALKAVLSDMKKENVKSVLCTGDCVGYYYHPDKVFEFLADWPVVFVRGNHEEMFIEVKNGAEEKRKAYKDRLGTGLEHALCKLDTRSVNSICEMPLSRTITFLGKKILLCHGSPWDIDEYVYPDSSIERFKQLSDKGYDAVVMGHTHYPMVKSLAEVLIINPGSVGQTRTFPGGAHWAILDVKHMTIVNKVTAYDYKSVSEEAAKNDPDKPYLSEVLKRFYLKREGE